MSMIKTSINRQFKKNRRASTPRNKKSASHSLALYAFLSLFFVFSLTSCQCESPTSPDALIPATNIVINGGDFTITHGLSGILTATVLPTNHVDGAVTWFSSDSNILIINATNTTNGVYKVLSNAHGIATVTAMVGAVSTNITITVLGPATNVVINGGDFTTTNGLSGILTATVLPTNHVDGAVTWLSSDATVFTITTNGHYSAPSNGTAIVTARVGTLSNAMTVTVQELLGTNITTSNLITTKVTNFYAFSNLTFSKRFESMVHYTTNATNSTNIFFFNANSNNQTTNYLSNLISVVTNTKAITNIVISTNNNYLSNIYITNYVTVTNAFTNRYTNVSFSTNVAINTDWNGLNFSTHVLSDLNFSNYNLSNANLSNANLSNANLSNANLIGANFINANFTNANLTNAWVNFEGYNYLAKNRYTGYRSRDFQKILAGDGGPLDEFGSSVSISGNIAIIGANNDDDRGDNSGSAYIFSNSNGTWSQAAKLTANDGSAGDGFGFSVSISGNTAIIGANNDDDRGTDSGSAYIFSNSSGTWSQAAKLTANDGAAGDGFGFSVSISDNTAIIGANNDDDRGNNSGSAYIFSRQTNGIWAQATNIIASNGQKTNKLLASDGAADDLFGHSVSISGDYAIVGAPDDDDKGGDSGSAYIFSRQSNTSWIQTNKLTANDGLGLDRFASSVSISGDTVIVGAYRDGDVTEALDDVISGSAYIFLRTNGTWLQTKIRASDPAAHNQFGFSVSISGDTAIVSGHGNNDRGNDSGSAYIFSREAGTNWIQSKIIASDGAIGDEFSFFVSISGDKAIVGARHDDDKGNNAGSAYVVEFR